MKDPLLNASEDWIPFRVAWDQNRPLIDWCYLGGTHFTEPFFQGTIRRVMRRPFSAAFVRRTSIDAWDDTASPDPSGLIFHMSRCGSTLISQMLKAIPGVTVYSEAPPVDALVRAPEAGIEVSQDHHASWLRWIARALGARGQKSYFLKLDCWHAVDLPLFRRAFPTVPWIFVYRDPIEVLASHAAQPAEWTDPGYLKALRFGFDASSIPPAALAEYRAHLLAGILRSVLESDHGSEGHLVNYNQLPDWGWTTLPGLFGLVPTVQEIAGMQAVATVDAKRSSFQFAPDAEKKHASAIPDLHALAEAHLYPLHRKLESLREQRAWA